MVTSIVTRVHKHTEVMIYLSKEVLGRVLYGGKHSSYIPYHWSIRGSVIRWFRIWGLLPRKTKHQTFLLVYVIWDLLYIRFHWKKKITATYNWGEETDTVFRLSISSSNAMPVINLLKNQIWLCRKYNS